ncbi:MAG TPA: ATP-binding cassette domain-containing protein [Spirochaetota bacterium]|nr:ATP-binding cassette domain-containing protein [Spirochaetota bacterium]OPZ39707.1 MAG: Sulfate/thiosulfate import ATP-binding protein CysA [Spirochaetes bacterium ADurb.BinA120]HNU92974.1 ATP-binding cassette domain-containing protein [Spirochaetota bacterium]HPI15521.1 ATP-binding cassette domain-containing protein [Spirochaetota bacterium]HPO45565.1 ATP-binding cassette domain-containing protein [Spirochaetota bacterium]
MIAARGVRLGFGGRMVLDGVELAVPCGGRTALLGKNGCGKSVLLKCVAGLIDEFEGEITVGGVDARRRAGAREGVSLAYVFQKGGLFDSMDVYDNVAFGLRRRGVPEDRVGEIVGGALRSVGLEGNERKLPSELSGGMQKRVGLARAVCLEPDIILYDDPTAGLDPILSDSIADLILEISEGSSATSIIVTHDLKLVEKVALDVALMYGGRISFRGACGDFFSREDGYARQFIEGETEGPIDIY